MADSIVKLKVESTEYDSKIKRAAQGLQHMEDACRKAHGTLAILDKEEKAFVQSLGKMETVSKDARGRIGELSKAFTDLRVQYNRLTDEEKNGDYGKALSASLEQLKTRINDAKSELDGINKEMSGNESTLDKLAEKYTGVGVAALSKFVTASALVTGALKVSKDAFFADEQNLDEWGRITASSESIYEGFLNALNTGNFSGYLTNINNIVSAAREAYDALDELGTFNAFNQINTEKSRTAFTEAMAGYREGTVSKEDVLAAAQTMKDELTARQQREQEGYLAKIRSIAADKGVDANMLQAAMEGSYGDYTQLKNTPLTGKGGYFTAGGMFGGSIYVETEVAANETEKLGQMLRKFNDTELQELQALGAQAQRTATEIAQVDKQTSRLLAANKTTTGSGNAPKITSPTPSDNTSLSGLESYMLMQGQQALAALENPMEAGWDEWYAGLGSKISDAVVATEELAEAGKAVGKDWGTAAGAISSVGSALSGIDDPAAKVLGTIAQAIAEVSLGYGKALSSKDATASGWAWLGFAAAATATMISSVAAIKSASAGRYADGGIVPGNSFSGDNQLAAVNAGELILNRSQQYAIASQLNGGFGNLHLSATIKGEDIRLALNNNSRRKMHGEYVTTR